MPPEELRLRLTHHERDSDKYHAVLSMLNDLLKLANHYLTWRRRTRPVSMTRREELEHRAATHCRECLASFETAEKKRHCHGAGQYLGALCHSCNIAAQTPKTIPVVFHNEDGYDFHFLLRYIATMGSPVSTESEASRLQDPLHAMAEANLNGAALFDVAGKSKDPERDLSALSAAARAKAIEVMGQLGKLGDETFPRILEYVGLRSKMYSILTVQPDGARKEKRKIKGVPKKAVTNVRHLEYREVLEEGSERRAAFAQLRSRAHEIAVETVEKKSLSPFNDKAYGLDAHNSRPLSRRAPGGEQTLRAAA